MTTSATTTTGPYVRRARALGPTRAVVVVLHGGRSVSDERTSPLGLSVLRLLPLARRVRRDTLLRGVAVWRVRYRRRGWNGAQQLPVHDTRWVLEDVRRRHGDVPVVLLGHSMGGRTAVHVAGDRSVRAVVGLAPWLSSSDPVPTGGRCRLALVHGDDDRMTSLAATLSFAERARAAGAPVTTVVLRRGEHFLLRRALLWHGLASALVRDALAGSGVGRPPRWGRGARALTHGERLEL